MTGNLFIQSVFIVCLEKQRRRGGQGNHVRPPWLKSGMSVRRNTEEVLIITPQMAYNFSVRLEESPENVTWENQAVLSQIRLTRMSVYVASTQTVMHNSSLDQAALLTVLISAAALLQKTHVNISVIYFPAETRQRQQFLREFSDTSHFLSILGAMTVHTHSY